MKNIAVLILCCISTFLFSQEKEAESIGSISTDRPDQTETPDVVPFKYFQMEMGFNIESQHKELSFVHPTILWKAGIFKSTEIRLITDISTHKDSTGKYRSGLSPVQIGFKKKNQDLRFHLLHTWRCLIFPLKINVPNILLQILDLPWNIR